MAENAPKPASGQEVEERIEDLTKEISSLINKAGTDGRDELRDYAVSLLQSETETTVPEEASGEGRTENSGPFNPIALSIPFLIIGIILLPLFAPVGLFMLLAAVVMGIGGGLALMFGRRSTPR